MEIVLADGIGVSSIEVEAKNGIEGIVIAANNYALETVRNGFSFSGYALEFDTEIEVVTRAKFRFIDFESGDGFSSPIYFEEIV